MKHYFGADESAAPYCSPCSCQRRRKPGSPNCLVKCVKIQGSGLPQSSSSRQCRSSSLSPSRYVIARAFVLAPSGQIAIDYLATDSYMAGDGDYIDVFRLELLDLLIQFNVECFIESSEGLAGHGEVCD